MFSTIKLSVEFKEEEEKKKNKLCRHWHPSVFSIRLCLLISSALSLDHIQLFSKFFFLLLVAVQAPNTTPFSSSSFLGLILSSPSGLQSKIRSSSSFTVSYLLWRCKKKKKCADRRDVIYRPKPQEMIGVLVLDGCITVCEQESVNVEVMQHLTSLI